MVGRDDEIFPVLIFRGNIEAVGVVQSALKNDRKGKVVECRWKLQ